MGDFIMSEDEYCAYNGSVCPVCGREMGTDFSEWDHGDPEVDGGFLAMNVTHKVCGSKWREFYALAGFEVKVKGAGHEHLIAAED